VRITGNRPSHLHARRRIALAVTAMLLALLVLSAAPAGATLQPPRAITGSVKHWRNNAGQLNGVVDPNGNETSYVFQYGPTSAYGQQTKPVLVGSGSKGVKVGLAVTGFLAGYHYRIVATAPNTEQPTKPFEVFGKEKTFLGTKSSKLKFNVARGKEDELIVAYGGTAQLQGSLSGTGAQSKGLTLQATPFPFTAAFVQLAGPVLSSKTGTFLFKVSKLLQNTEFRVLTTDARPLYSPTMLVHVEPLIVLHVRTAGHGRFRFYGTIAPATVHGTIVLQQLKPQKAGSKKEGPRPHTVGTAAIKKAGKTFSRFSTVIALSGNFRYRAYIKLAKGPLVSGHSSNVLVKAPKSAATEKHARRHDKKH
jgi:hypothetical protein